MYRFISLIRFLIVIILWSVWFCLASMYKWNCAHNWQPNKAGTCALYAQHMGAVPIQQSIQLGKKNELNPYFSSEILLDAVLLIRIKIYMCFLSISNINHWIKERNWIENHLSEHLCFKSMSALCTLVFYLKIVKIQIDIQRTTSSGS